MNLGSTIKDLRKQRTFTQDEFAKKCGITQTYLSQIENDQREPNLSTLKVIAGNLDVPLPILFFLSLDEADIKQQKRKAFNSIGPAVRSLINEFFQT